MDVTLEVTSEGMHPIRLSIPAGECKEYTPYFPAEIQTIRVTVPAAAAWAPSEEHVREGVRLIKAWGRLRTPPYSLPSDATITETVRAILALPAPPKE